MSYDCVTFPRTVEAASSQLSLSSSSSSSSLHREENQLYVTEYFIALMIHPTCFGHFYAHHQELETVCVLLPPMVCSAWLLVVGGQVQGSRLSVQEEGCCTTVVVQRCVCVEKKNQLDVTVCFIALMIRSTYFGHFYAHHHEL